MREYLKDLNGTQAAIRAGYAEKGAAVTASKLLKNPKVAEAIAAAQKKAAKRADLTVDDIVRAYREIIEADITDVLAWEGDTVTIRASAELPEHVTRCIAEVRQHVTKGGKRYVTLKMHSKADALAKLGKHLGMFIERTEAKVAHDFGGITPQTADQIRRQILGVGS